METPIEGLGLLHMRGSGVEGLSIFLGFILSPAGIFRPYIEFRETHKSSLSFLDVHSGSLQPCNRGEGVCIWRVQLKPIYNIDSLKMLKPKMFRILHISYPKIWVTIFIERWVSISNFQFNIVLYSFGQHSLDSKFFSFWKQFPEVFYCLILVINLTTSNFL